LKAGETNAILIRVADVARVLLMGTIYFASPRSLYQARPGRAALVAEDLSDLRGPVTGTLVLPLRLFWSPHGRRWCLDDRDDLLEVYEVVLQEAARPADLTGFIHGPTLVERWPHMWVPRGVARAWEDCHEVLRGAQSLRGRRSAVPGPDCGALAGQPGSGRAGPAAVP
jgi:hypothetical protein